VGALRLRVRPEHIPLLEGQWADVELTSRLEDPGDFDCCVVSYSLPHIFGVERPEDVACAPYLRPPARRFRALPGELRVGIRWAGNPSHSEDLMRSTDLAAWASVLDVPSVTFYSLQLEGGAEQLRQYSDRIHDLSPELTDWERTAAAMMEVDLVISVDTSCAHLAGALGRPVWVLLSAVPEWRWMLESPTTPWYPSARLFRQPRIGEWAPVFAQVADALREILALGQLDVTVGMSSRSRLIPPFPPVAFPHA
jgi:hypothetical protein